MLQQQHSNRNPVKVPTRPAHIDCLVERQAMDSMLPPGYTLGQVPHVHQQQQYVSQGIGGPQQPHYASYNDHTPSSGDADSPADVMSMHYSSVSNENGKRPAAGPAAVAESRKKARKTGDDDNGAGEEAQNSPQGNGAGDGDGKVKSARGSRSVRLQLVS